MRSPWRDLRDVEAGPAEACVAQSLARAAGVGVTPAPGARCPEHVVGRSGAGGAHLDFEMSACDTSRLQGAT